MKWPLTHSHSLMIISSGKKKNLSNLYQNLFIALSFRYWRSWHRVSLTVYKYYHSIKITNHNRHSIGIALVRNSVSPIKYDIGKKKKKKEDSLLRWLKDTINKKKRLLSLPLKLIFYDFIYTSIFCQEGDTVQKKKKKKKKKKKYIKKISLTNWMNCLS